MYFLTLSDKGDINNENIRNFQIKNFGNPKNNHCSLELMPLPCPSTKEKD